MLTAYVKLLKDNELKVTPQRLEILKYLDQHHTHPTADDIYCALKTKYPSLSKTTVYNSLETLKQHRLITGHTFRGTEARYDINRGHHHHFLCESCGAIIDIDIPCPNINKVINKGYRINEVHGYFKGICKDCMNKRKVTLGEENTP